MCESKKKHKTRGISLALWKLIIFYISLKMNCGCVNSFVEVNVQNDLLTVQIVWCSFTFSPLALSLVSSFMIINVILFSSIDVRALQMARVYRYSSQNFQFSSCIFIIHVKIPHEHRHIKYIRFLIIKRWWKKVKSKETVTDVHCIWLNTSTLNEKCKGKK